MYKKNMASIAAYIGLFTVGNVLVSFGVMSMYLKNRFSLDEISMGSIPALLSFGTLIGSIVFGPVVDRYGYKILTITSTMIIITGFEKIALGDSLILIYISFFLLGLGAGIINGSTTALIADISLEDKGANLSFLHAFFAIGALTMPFVSGFFLKYYTLDRIFFYFGIVILLSIIFYLRIIFPAPKQAHGLPWKKVFLLVKDIPLLFFSFFLFLQGGLDGLINNWTIRFIENKYSSEMSNLIYLLSFYFIGMIIIRFSLGRILKKLRALTILFLGLSMALCGISLLWFSTSYFYIISGIVVLGTGFAPIFPVLLGYISERFTDLSGTALGVAFIFALSGGVIFNFLMGVISKTFGIDKYPVILILVSFIMIILVTRIPQINLKERKI